MQKFFVLGNFTDKGFSAIKESADFFKQAREVATGNGVKIESIFLLMGNFDFAFNLEAQSFESIATFLLTMDQFGKFKTVTFPAFSESDFPKILSKI